MSTTSAEPVARTEPQPQRSRKSSVVFLLTLIALIVGVTLCNKLPESHALHVSNYMVTLLDRTAMVLDRFRQFRVYRVDDPAGSGPAGLRVWLVCVSLTRQRSEDVRLGLFIASGVTLLLVYILCDMILRSRMGKDITSVPAEGRAAIGIGYVPQGRQIFPLLSVEENLRIGLRARGDCLRTIPDLICDQFPVLKEILHRHGGDLSGGQQQQLAIGRALVTQPELLLLDEPTEGIQPNVVQDIGTIITRLNKKIDLTVIPVEQELPHARRVGDDYVSMDRGEDLVRQYLTV